MKADIIRRNEVAETLKGLTAWVSFFGRRANKHEVARRQRQIAELTEELSTLDALIELANYVGGTYGDDGEFFPV